MLIKELFLTVPYYCIGDDVPVLILCRIGSHSGLFEKRTLFTVISLVLCTTLIFSTLLLVSSIKNGFAANIETEYNDYHLVLKDISSNEFNKIKDKTYIDKLYIQDVDGRKIKSSRFFIYTTK